LTCYTEVESNGRDAPYQTQTGCKRATTGKRHACAQMTVSPKPHAPKVSQHGLTYLSTGWTTRNQGWSNSQGPKDQVHAEHTGFRCACKIRLQQAQTPQNCGHSLDVLSRVLTCYTGWEQWSRRSIPNPNLRRASGEAKARIAQMTVSPSPHAPKVSPARFDPLRWTIASRIIELRARPQDLLQPPHTWFQCAHRDSASTSRNSSKIAATSSMFLSKFDLLY
jgi:hypothetical protein